MAKQGGRPRSTGKSSFGKRQGADDDFRKKKKDGDTGPKFTKGGKFRSSTGGSSDKRDSGSKYPRSGGSSSGRSYGRSEGRSEGGERRSYGKPSGERRSYGGPRGDSAGGERRSYGKPSGERRSYGGPRGDSAGGERRSYGKPRGDSAGGESRGYSSRPRRDSEGGGEKRSYKPRGDSERGGEGSPRPYVRRGPSSASGERRERPYSKGAGADRGKRPFSKERGEGSGERRSGSRYEGGARKFDGPPKFSDRGGKKGGFDKKDDADFDKPILGSEEGNDFQSAPKKAPREKKSFVESKADKERERPTAAPDESTENKDGLIRLNKFISNSGVCSRREADELIKMGLISVNGVTITEMGHKVKATDDVRHEGKKLTAERPVYILLNKPKGFITTTDDPQERNTVMELIAGACKERVYPVGRLDRNTTGLLLLTNDGDLTDKLTHPSFNAKKIYKVELDKPLTKDDFQKILDGVRLEEGKAMVDDLAIVSDDGLTVGIELHIGWNHIVRRIFDSLEYKVVKLDRVVYAGLDKKDLKRGQWRFLKTDEIVRLKHFK